MLQVPVRLGGHHGLADTGRRAGDQCDPGGFSEGRARDLTGGDFGEVDEERNPLVDHQLDRPAQPERESDRARLVTYRYTDGPESVHELFVVERVATFDLVYVGISGPRVENGRLVSPANSGIRTVADLRGKRVGIAHGSWQTTLALLALDREGLRWSDIVPVDLDVNDGGAALLRGDIDAWVGAYPALAEVETTAQVHTLIDTDGLFSHPSLWFVRREFAENHRPVLEAIITALQESDAWIVANPREAARFFVEDAHGAAAPPISTAGRRHCADAPSG